MGGLEAWAGESVSPLDQAVANARKKCRDAARRLQGAPPGSEEAAYAQIDLKHWEDELAKAIDIRDREKVRA